MTEKKQAEIIFISFLQTIFICDVITKTSICLRLGQQRLIHFKLSIAKTPTGN